MRSSNFSGSFKTFRPVLFREIEDRLHKFIQLARNASLPVSYRSVQTYAFTIRDNFISSEEDQVKKGLLETFTASSNWTNAFLKRYSVRSVCLHGQGGIINVMTVANDISELRRKLGKYSAECIFNMDEIGLFFKMFPKKSYVLPGESKKELRGTQDMKAKARVSLFVCTNSSGTLKLPLAVIGTAKNPRAFRKGQPPLKYFSQKNAWSDTVTFKRWFCEVFLPFVRKHTSQPVALVMDNCGPHSAELLDTRQQVDVLTLPPNCTSKFQPMDMGIIAALKLRYKTIFLKRVLQTLPHRQALRERANGMARGTKGLDEGHHPHMLDVCEMIFEAWEQMSLETVARCWVKSNILPRSIHTDLIGEHGKVPNTSRSISQGALNNLLQAFTALQLEAGACPDISERIHEVNEEDVERWGFIESDNQVQEALNNEAMEAIEQVVLSGSGEEDNVGESSSEEEAVLDIQLPSVLSIYDAFEDVEKFVDGTGMSVATMHLRRAKREMLEASRSSGNKRQRQTMINEHFQRH